MWKQPLEDIYPSEYEKVKYPKLSYANRSAIKSASTFAKPTVFIPIFPETNCEYDSAVAFEKAGAKIETFVMKNLSPEDIKYSVDMISKHIRQSQIVMLAGGYSAGDEPGGSSKFAVTVFKNEKVKDAINDLLKNRDGLILGIGSGFQALLRLGLVPFGEIREMDDTCPTLTYNTIGRHISCMVKTR